jgi:hypothetical protein
MVEEVGRILAVGREGGERTVGSSRSFESGLFYAIHLLRSTKWVRETGALQQTEACDEWLHLAYEHLDDSNLDAKKVTATAGKDSLFA